MSVLPVRFLCTWFGRSETRSSSLEHLRRPAASLWVEQLEDRTLLSDFSVVPLWDGERPDPSGRLLNYFGGNPLRGIRASVSYTTAVRHSGTGAFRIDTNGTILGGTSVFIASSLTGFGPNANYSDTRDILHYQQVEFWVRNETGSPFSLTFEIKDYRDSVAHRAQRSYPISTDAVWRPISVPLDLSTGWVVSGSPDLSRAKLFAFSIEANQRDANGNLITVNNGSIYLDDMVLFERGGTLDPQTAPANVLLERLTRRQFDALWGSRDRDTGLLPTISSFADVTALNVTAAMVKLLPVAVSRSWVSRATTDDYVRQVVASLGQAMVNATTLYGAGFLPPRYVDRVTLRPTFGPEESSADGAYMFLALYQYKSLPGTPADVRSAIEGLLNRFNFAAFSSPQGWRLAYRHTGTDRGFTTGTYDGYSGETWAISLAAHLATNNRVDITTLYHSGTKRVKTFLVDPAQAHLVHGLTDFRAPFTQWVFPLLVKLDNRGRDTYPDPQLASNPYENAVLYQRDVHAQLALVGRRTLLQADAGDDGTGMTYRQFSAYNDFGQPDLFMPWSVALSLLADPVVAEAALREQLSHGLHDPFGLVDSVHWPTGQVEPTLITARNDLWNTSLSTMALVQYLYGANEFLAALPEVRSALDKVFFVNITVGGQVFNDRNGDGVKQSGELGMPGGTVYLDANNNGLFDTGELSTVSEAAGNYSFPNLGPGTYRVRQLSQAGWLQTTPNPTDITAQSGTNAVGHDFGNFERFSLSGQALNDLNGNGQPDAGEPGLPGWTIFLDSNNNGTLDAGEPSTNSDVGGTYSFPNLGPGTYRVRQAPQAGWLQTTAIPLSVVAVSGLNVTGANFGNFRLIALSGQVFHDFNGTGTKETGEPGLSGWTVFLDANNNGILDVGERSAVTDVGGSYTVADLGPGIYRLRQVPQSGWVQTTPNPADLTARSGTNVTGLNLGNTRPGITGRAFHDLNGNGTADAGEPGLPGWIIFLDSINNGTLDNGEPSATTNAEGYYAFPNVPVGSHTVREVVQAGWMQSRPGGPGFSYVVTLGANQVASARNFGNFRLAELRGTVFDDLNGNRTRDAGEPALPGWTVFVDANNNGQLDAGETAATTATTGAYAFSGLQPGIYAVREVVQSGWQQTRPGAPDFRYLVTLMSGQSLADQDFGNMRQGGGGGHFLPDTAGREGNTAVTEAEAALFLALPPEGRSAGTDERSHQTGQESPEYLATPLSSGNHPALELRTDFVDVLLAHLDSRLREDLFIKLFARSGRGNMLAGELQDVGNLNLLRLPFILQT